MSRKTVAIIQARVGSTRLPRKVLADLAGEPLLMRVVQRARAARGVDEVIVATTELSEDDAIVSLCEERGVTVSRGSSDDVLSRFTAAAGSSGAEVIVRLTGDCPLIDPDLITEVIERLIETGADYATNTIGSSYPDGMDTEAFTSEALKRADSDAKDPFEREHVTVVMRDAERFKVASVLASEAMPNLRLTVDEERDLDLARAIYQRMGSEEDVFGLQAIVDLISHEPELTTLNERIPRDEGFYLSLLKEPPVEPRVRSLDASKKMYERASDVIPSASQTFSKSSSQFVQGVAPTFLERGKGALVWDIDGNEYIDHAMALGPVILGHAYPEVDLAVTEEISRGVAFTLPHPLEVEVAEILVERIPCAEMVRFGKNGSDATTGAVRAARALTGRDMIVCCGYHGWHDWFIGTTTRRLGIPDAVADLTKTFDYNDIASLEALFADHPGRIAAVIMEPIGIEEPTDGFLEKVRQVTHQAGALLVFDEVITGFRFAPGGAQEYFGVIPDLACFGKALSNGFPLSAVVGSQGAMRIFDETFFSFTFGGETASLAAARATLERLGRPDVIPHIAEQGRRLKDGFNTFATAFGIGDNARCVGLAPRTVCTFAGEGDDDRLVYKSLFQQECIKRGVLFTGSHLPSLSHGQQEIDETLRVYRSAMEILAGAIERGDVEELLEGPPVQDVFRSP